MNGRVGALCQLGHRGQCGLHVSCMFRDWQNSVRGDTDLHAEHINLREQPLKEFPALDSINGDI